MQCTASEGLLPQCDKSVIQVRQVCEVGLESEVSKFGVSTKFEHHQTNSRYATVRVYINRNGVRFPGRIAMRKALRCYLMVAMMGYIQ